MLTTFQFLLTVPRPVDQVKPPAPEGLLEVTQVTVESVHLKWEKPRHDGCNLGYTVEVMEPKTELWKPVLSTKLLEVDVGGLEDGWNAILRVRAVNSAGTSEPLEMARDSIRTYKGLLILLYRVEVNEKGEAHCP